MTASTNQMIEKEECTTEDGPSCDLRPSQSRRRRWSSRLSLSRLSLRSRRVGSLCEDDVDVKVAMILSSLSDDELEIAAQASYDYKSESDLEEKETHAKRIVLRYLESKNGDVQRATEKLNATLQFRKDMDIAGLVQTFSEEANSKKYFKPLKEHLSSKQMFVMGYDKEGRSNMYFVPRRVESHDVEWTVKEAVYSIERAIACSKATDRTINAVVDFSGFSVTKHSPPLEIGKQFLTTLRSHYVGQIHSILLMDTPFSFGLLWKMFSPFVGTTTRNKIHFASGKKAKSKLQTAFSLDEVPSWMIPGGKKNRELDLNEYLLKTPFRTTFNEQPSS